MTHHNHRYIHFHSVIVFFSAAFSIKRGGQAGSPGSATRDGLHLNPQLLRVVANEGRSQDQQQADAAPLPLAARDSASLCFTLSNKDDKHTQKGRNLTAL